MPIKIIVPASDVWSYFQDTKADLKSHMHQIAGNPEYGVEIFITEDSGCPSIVVTADDVHVYEETVLNEHDCRTTVSKIYDDYLSNKAITLLTGEDDADTVLDIEDVIAEREEELTSAIYDLIMVATQESYLDAANLDDIIEDCKDHFLEYMARKHEIPVYRPMILEYDDGEEEVSEFPYDDMEFDDPDNPIYKV